MNAGGPYEMTIAGGGQRIAVRDILVGDVWVASGQSNMEWPVASSVNAAAEIASANDVKIREFAIPHSYSEKPEAEVVGGVWAHADSQQVGHFSAVAYFLRPRSPKVGRRADRHHPHVVGWREHRDVDEPRGTRPDGQRVARRDDERPRA